MHSRLRPSPAMVIALIALFVSLGGTAAALSGSNTVFTDDITDNEVRTADVRNDTLSGGGLAAVDLKPSSVGTSEVVNGGLTLSDLNATSRPHKLQFGVPGGTAKTTLATIGGHLQVSAECQGGGSFPGLKVFLKNLSAATGTQNALITMQDGSEGTVALDTSGSFVGAGAEVTLDRTDANNNLNLAGGSFNRAEGQVVFETPGRVTTITFHGSTATGLGCQFFGMAVTSNLS